MTRTSLIRARIASALKRSAAWQAEKNAAPSPEIAASFGASSRNSNVDHSEAANSAAIETPMTTPSPIKAGANDNPFRHDVPTSDGAGQSARAARSYATPAPASASAARTPAAQGVAPAAIKLPRIAPRAMPADAAACSRARIG